MSTSTPSRLSRVKRRQGLAAVGAYRASDDPFRVGNQAGSSMPPPGIPVFEVATHEEIEQYRNDFFRLLPVATGIYGYRSEDRDTISFAMFPPGVNLLEDHGRRTDLRLTLRAWMIDLISRDLGDQVPLELEFRARSTFRQHVMGATTDENGLPYAGLWLEKLEKRAGEITQPF